MKKLTIFCLVALSILVLFNSCKEDDKEITNSTDKTIAVSGISLNKSSSSLVVGSTDTLVAILSPSNVTDKTIIWTTSDATKATVLNGVVRALASGTVTITAKAGDKIETCIYTITTATIPVTSISLNKTVLYFLVGETPISSITLTANVKPNNATNPTVAWTSNNTSIATVSSNGTLTLTTTSVGTANITAKAGNYTATCIIKVSALQIGSFVTINGVNWATCNVNTPGTFTSSPTVFGYFYQWNSKVGWPSTGAIGSITATNGTTIWNSSWNGGYATPSTTDTWTTINDPSPLGWRVPTKAEIKTLLDTAKVIRTATTQNSVYGRKYTDKTSGNSIFLPAVGFRYDSGLLGGDGTDGGYWGSVALGSDYGYILGFDIYEIGDCNGVTDCGSYRAYGRTVRPVAQ